MRRVLPALCLLTACVQGSKIPKDVLVIGVESEIKNLDFRYAVDANTSHVMRLFSQALIEIDESLQPVPDFALSWKTDDAQTFHFELPSNAVFHNGAPVSCKDVEASFRQSGSNTSRLKSSLRQVESYTCTSPTHFVIKLKVPNASFVAAELPLIRILPANIIFKDDISREIIGTGPYIFRKRDGRDLVFERFENYAPGRSRPLFFKRVIVRSIEDPTTRFLSILGGDVDVLMNALSPKRVVEASENKNLQVFRGPGNNYTYLGFNLRLKKFQDHRVRLALAISIPRDEIIQHKLLGYGMPATSVLAPRNAFRNDELKPFPYDPDRARALLKEAGAENLEIEIKSSSDRDVISMLLVIQESWQKIGIKVSLKPYEFGTFFSDVQKGNVEMYMLKWSGVVEPDIMNKILHSREFPPGRNRTYYVNKEVDALLERGEREAQVEIRKKIYNKVQAIVYEEIPYLPLWYPDNIVVATRELKGFRLHPGGSWAPLWNSRKESP